MSKYLDEKAKKMLIYLGAVVGIIVLIIVVILIVNAVKGVSLSYSEIEDKMVSAAREYYSLRPDALPLNDKDEVEISAVTLSEEKHMKDLSKYQKDKNVSCSGKVVVTKSKEYYNYSPYLNCGDKYTTSYLYEKVLSTIVSKDDGLYKTQEYSPEKKSQDTYYVYKGDYVNNYVKIGEMLLRIIKMDSNYDLILTEAEFNRNIGYNGPWDDRYNSSKNFAVGINDYYKSLIRRGINNNYYNSLDDTLKSKLILKNICVAPRSENDTKKDGSTECKITIDTDYIGLITTYDYMNASLDSNCKTIVNQSCSNYNYLINYNRTYWLANPNSKNTYTGYKINRDLSYSNLSTYAVARNVFNVGKNLIYTGGSGTQIDPYLVK